MTKKITFWFLFLSILFTQFLNAEEKFWSLKNEKVNVRYGHGKTHSIKYIYREDHKDANVEDIGKTIWYLTRLLNKMEDL